jgi:hypothetical protein
MIMFSDSSKKFLFKCEDCEMILSVILEDKEDLKKVNDNEMYLECPCGGMCLILRN